MKLLLLHDNSLFSTLIVEFLRFQGYTVCEANDAETAHATVVQRRVDLVVWVVPAERPENFTHLAELSDRHSSLPLIAIETHSVSSELQAQIRQRTPYYLTKPFTVTSLQSMIADATGIRKMKIPLSPAHALTT